MQPPVDIAWFSILPLILLTATGLLTLICDLFIESPDRDGLGWIGVLGFAATAIAAALIWPGGESTLAGVLNADAYALFFTVLLCASSALVLLISMNYLETTEIRVGDYYTLVVFATLGMVVMAYATELIVIFLALELMSIAVYVLAGMARSDLESNEAALKYFLLGAFATGFLLFGIAMVYGATGSTNLFVIRESVVSGQVQSWLLLCGTILLLVGFGFKIAAVPFHAWAPDVYQGAPVSVTALMAVGVKAAAFAAFVRIFLGTLASLSADWSTLLTILSVATMTVGNVLAVLQTNVKRMLAYSSIAHAGYLLVGMVAGAEVGGAALLYYLVAYGFMTIGAFAVLAAVTRKGEALDTYESLAGLGFRSPFLGLTMTICMLSLAGIPPLAGFVGKFYLFGAAIASGHTTLAIVGVLNSAISIYYYFGVLGRMYVSEGDAAVESMSRRPLLAAGLGIASAGTVLIGIFPSWLYYLARESIRSIATF